MFYHQNQQQYLDFLNNLFCLLLIPFSSTANIGSSYTIKLKQITSRNYIQVPAQFP